MERVNFTEITDFKNRISWGSVFAGVVTVIAVSILLSILGSSISLYMLDPQSSEPTSGIGTTMGIWTAVALILSLAAGGFVAGKLAGRDGIIHGFIVWSTTMIATVVLVAFLAMGAVRLTGNILGSVASAVGGVVSGVGSAVGDGLSAMGDDSEGILSDIGFTGDVSRQEVRQDIRQALRRSGVREFQPEYLQNQLQAVRSDLNRSVRRLVTNPSDAENIINAFLERVKQRTEVAFRDVDRNDLTRAIANNSNLSQAEVNRAVDEYIDIIQSGVEEGRQQIDNLQQSVEQLRQDWEVTKQNALEEANRISNATATSALIAFFALLIGAAIAAFAGLFGARKTQEGYEV
ncbi:MAG: hypothetical protein LIO93_00390 [Bacteroidales bacterium]|nr:hypothetical protein [Bacteroidales bacterium]